MVKVKSRRNSLSFLVWDRIPNSENSRDLKQLEGRRGVGWAGTDSTLNRCASGSSSSIPMASSPVSTLERLSGPLKANLFLSSPQRARREGWLSLALKTRIRRARAHWANRAQSIYSLLTNWLAFLRYRENAAFDTRTLVWCFPRIQC